ncbi:MAG: 4-carboxy-4-hydroxy-2-oxoadipate aldolase/oxaloacetate decarboxylase, partial [Candidatus Puniceispirillaceae bacterium]
VIAADDDGVAVVARSQAEVVMEQAQARLDGEEAKRQKLANGELGLDIYGMRKRLADAGLVYVEDLETLGDFNGIDCRRQ